MTHAAGTEYGRHFSRSLAAVVREMSPPSGDAIAPAAGAEASASLAGFADTGLALPTHDGSVGIPELASGDEVSVADEVIALDALPLPGALPAFEPVEPVAVAFIDNAPGEAPGLSGFDPSKYLTAGVETRAATTDEIPMAAASAPPVGEDEGAVEYVPGAAPGAGRDSRAVLAMLHELSTLHDD